VRLIVEEIDGAVVRRALFAGAARLAAEPLDARPFEGVVQTHRAFTVHADLFDHGIPVLGVAIRETERLSVNKDRLERIGLVPGPWLAELKQHVRRCAPASTPLAAAAADGTTRTFEAGDLAAELLARTPGQRLVYLTDLRHTAENRARALRLAEGVDLLICETTFLDEDRALAAERGHLTARQAGTLAREAGARRLAPFHFSPRYQGREQALIDEAARAFGGPVIALPAGPLWDAGDQRC
jgi:ribonuclease Z